jgi:hypothetical protein
MSKGKVITAEMAASVVRDFILPMFETDGKKLMRQKNKKAISKRMHMS